MRRDRRCVAFLSKKRDVRRHGKARVMRRDRGESDLENAKNRVLLACCCCPPTRKGESHETRPSVCCFLSKKRDVRRHGKATYLRRDRRCVVFISKKRDVRRHGKATYLRRDRRCVVFCRKTGCPPTRKSESHETRPSMCCFLSKNAFNGMSADTKRRDT